MSKSIIKLICQGVIIIVIGIVSLYASLGCAYLTFVIDNGLFDLAITAISISAIIHLIKIKSLEPNGKYLIGLLCVALSYIILILIKPIVFSDADGFMVHILKWYYLIVWSLTNGVYITIIWCILLSIIPEFYKLIKNKAYYNSRDNWW